MLSWIGGVVEQMVPNLEDGNKVLVQVELLMIRIFWASLGAPCTGRVHAGPSVREVMLSVDMHFLGSKNSDSFNGGNGKSRDSLGRKSQPLGSMVGCKAPQKTVLPEEGNTMGYFSS